MLRDMSMLLVAVTVLAVCGSCRGQPLVIELGPGGSWEDAGPGLAQIERLLKEASDANNRAWNQEVAAQPQKQGAQKAAPWTWHELDADFQHAIREVKPGRALDLGSGSGTQSMSLAEQGWEVIGVDNGAQIVEGANAEAKRRGLSATFVEGNVLQPSSLLGRAGFERGSFDLIIDRGCLHAVYSMERNLVEAVYFFLVRYLLKPGGLLLVKAVHPSAYAGLGASMMRLVKMLRYHIDQESIQQLMYLSKFWLLPTGHFNPHKPAPFSGEALQALVSKHMETVAVNDETLMQVVVNNTVMLGLQMPVATTFVVGKLASGTIHIATTPMTEPLDGYLHLKDVLSAKQHDMYQKQMETLQAMARKKAEL